MHPFRNSLTYSSLFPHPIQSWSSEKILDTRVQHCLWGEGRGWTCVNWKTPQRHKSVPRRLNCSRMQIAVLQLPTEENLFLGVNKVKPHKQVKNTRNAYRLDQRRGEFLRWYWYGSIGRPLAWWWFHSSLGLNPYPLPPSPLPSPAETCLYPTICSDKRTASDS